MNDERHDDPVARWKRVDAILDRLFELDGEARERELLAFTEDDDVLRDEVRALLAADADSSQEFDRFLEEGVAPFAADALGDEDTFEEIRSSEKRLGPYELDRVLGSGGMSVVYLGRRRDGAFEQDVAIKVMRHPGRHPDLVRRFRIERQILANLRHPNIGRILDGGVTSSGWPYLVMEKVDGLPLNDHCAQYDLDLRARLELFDQVCAAVHHAHQRLVVHRDLKPSNILVTRDGHVKLLDFGIAKLLDDETGTYDQTVPLTETGLRLFTPDYGAPEQVKGDPITTATDVYALGVLLYELLAGERPYRLQGRRASDIERIVCEEDPAPPSTTAVRTGAPNRPHTRSHTRADTQADTQIDTMARARRDQLRGDLDTICLKALRKEPERRYASAQDLASDLERYRQGQPVSARPATARYRLSKFVRRNRLGVAATSAVVLLSLGFAVTATVQEAQTARAREHALREAATATEIKDFVLSLFRASDPYASRADTLSVADLLDRGEQRTTELANQPAVRAEMLSVIATAQRNLGHFDRAASIYEGALRVMEDADLTDDDLYSAIRSDYGSTLMELGVPEDALALQQASLDIRRRVFGDDDPRTARSFNAVGRTLQELGRFDAAESSMVRALEIFERHDDSTRERVTVRNNLATIRAEHGDFASAVQLTRTILEERIAMYGSDHPRVAETYQNLGVFCRRLGKNAEAEAHYRESLRIKRIVLPEDHPSTARTLDNLAIAIGVQGRYDECEDYFLQALAMRKELLGEDHPRVASSYSNLSTLMGRKGDPEGAERYSRRAVETFRRGYDGPNRSFASALRNHAIALGDLDRLDEAQRVGEEALAMYIELHGEDGIPTAVQRGNLAAIYLRQGDASRAESMRREAITAETDAYGPDHPGLATSWQGLGNALVALDRSADADSAYAEAVRIRRVSLGEDHPQTLEAIEALQNHRARHDDR